MDIDSFKPPLHPGYGLKDFNGNRLLSKGCKISVETGKVLIATKLITDCDLLDAVLGQEGHITDWKERRQKAVENVAQCITYWAFGSKTKLSEDTGSQLVKEITSTIDAGLSQRARASRQAKQCTFDEVSLAFQEHTERGLGEPCLIEQQVSDGEGNTDKQYDSHVSFKTVWELLLRDQVEHLRHLDRPDASKLVNTLVDPILQAAKKFTTGEWRRSLSSSVTPDAYRRLWRVEARKR